MREKITRAELVERFESQGVSGKRHYAVKCVVCDTVQSMTSLVAAGAPKEKAGYFFGFSCEGRLNGAGEWPREVKNQTKRTKRGCDWFLGGLFTIHKLEVHHDGKIHPFFNIASAEEAQALEAAAKPGED